MLEALLIIGGILTLAGFVVGLLVWAGVIKCAGKALGALMLGVAVALCAGCTVTRMETLEGGGFAFSRYSLLQKVDAPRVTVTEGKTVTLDGYTNDGGAAIIGVAVEKAVEAAVRSAVK